MKILAIDPGTTTGLAFFIDGQVQTMTCPSAKVLPLIRQNKPEEFVIERFATSGRISKYGIETIDLVGQVKGWCFAHDLTLTLQSPQSRHAWQQEAKDWLGNKKRVGVHEDDSLAHLMQFLKAKGIRWP